MNFQIKTKAALFKVIILIKDKVEALKTIKSIFAMPVYIHELFQYAIVDDKEFANLNSLRLDIVDKNLKLIGNTSHFRKRHH